MKIKQKCFLGVMLLLVVGIVGMNITGVQAAAPKTFSVDSINIYCSYYGDSYDPQGGVNKDGYLGVIDLRYSPFDTPRISLSYYQVLNIYLSSYRVKGYASFIFKDYVHQDTVVWMAFYKRGYYTSPSCSASSGAIPMYKGEYHVYYEHVVWLSGGSPGDWGRMNSAGSLGSLTVTFLQG